MILQHSCYFTHALSFLLYVSLVHADENVNMTFPDGFLIGTATSSYQIEGAWNVSDKGESIWDRYTHTRPDKITDGSNGDISCDSYHKFKKDIQLIKQMGMDFYRFSMSWPRILPTGYSNVVSRDGIQHYNNILDELERNNIKPFVTLYHWDHPQVFQDIGGWTNEDMVNLFGDYARVVYREFGSRVKMFITINEPQTVCYAGYFVGAHAPGLQLGKHAEYLCSHNMLKAHARAYHIYNKEFRAQQNGIVGIVLNTFFYFPKNANDTDSGEIAFQFTFGRFAHPIFSKEGDYPDIVKKRIAENSKFEGLPRSRLPTFSKKWINYIRGTSDFLGLNHYTSQLVEPAPKSNNTIYLEDEGLIHSYDENWPSSATPWLKVVPQGMSEVLMKINEEYGNPPVYITENGISDNGTKEDPQRIEYLYTYMSAMVNAINRQGCNVKAYTIWSLLDNFEWNSGYIEKFGLVHVDFTNQHRTRTPKQSVQWLTNVILSRTLHRPDSLMEQEIPRMRDDSLEESSGNFLANNIVLTSVLCLEVIILSNNIWVNLHNF